METQIFEKYQRLFLAEDCRPPQLNECLLWRKQTLRTIISASANDRGCVITQYRDRFLLQDAHTSDIPVVPVIFLPLDSR